MIEKTEPNWLTGFEKDTTPTTNDFGYIPLPTTVQGESEGSVYAAHLRQDNTIGSLLNRHSTYQLDEETKKNYDFTQYASQIPRDLIPYADKFYGATSEEEFKSVEAAIRQELGDKSKLSAHPWQSLAYSIDPLEPMNWLSFGVIFKGLKAGSRVARGLMGAGITALDATGQEAILHQNQLTRTMQESIFNVAAAGIVGGVLGSLGAGIKVNATSKSVPTPTGGTGVKAVDVVSDLQNIAAKDKPSLLEIEDAEGFSISEPVEGIPEYSARKNMQLEVLDVLTEKDRPLTPSGILTPDDLARMPKFAQVAMQITPMNRLINSPFPTAKWFASAAYEHNYTLIKNTDGVTGGASLERSMKLDYGKVANTMVKYQDIYFGMHGVQTGVFRGTRAKRSEINMNRDQFDDAVSLVLTTEQPHPNEHVNKAAQLLRAEVFDKYKNEAEALGLLPEDVTVPNAVNYFTVLYNKNKIIEQGGRSARGAGTFPQYLFEQFKVSNEITKQFIQSPAYKNAKAKIKELNERINAVNTEAKQPEIPETFQINIKTIEAYPDAKEVLDTISIMTKKLHGVDEKIKKIDADIAAEKTKLLNAAPEEKAAIDKHIDDLEYHKDYVDIEERYDLEFDYNEAWKYIYGLINQGDIPRAEFFNAASTANIYIPKSDKSIASSLKADLVAFKKLHPQTRSPARKSIEKSRVISPEERQKLTKTIEELEQSILDNAPQEALTWEGKLHKVLDDEDTIWAHVEQTVDNVLGNTEGKLLNPFFQTVSGGGKPLKTRKLLVDQEQAREWHITNATKVADAYSRAMVPVIRLTEFAQNLGFKDINEMKTGIGNLLKKEYDTQSAGVTGKAAQKLLKEYEANISDMKASIDLLMGVYGDGPNVLNSTAKEYYQNFLKWNYVRLLGFMTVSSIADAGSLVFTHGIYRTMHDGILKSFSGVKNITKQDLRGIGYGIETELGTRIKSYAEHSGLSTNPSPFTKGLDSLTQNFGNLSFMNHWNSLMQNLAGHVSINRSLETIHKFVKGEKIKPKDIERMARLGVDKEYFETIYKFTKDNIDESGAHYADWQNWDIKNSFEAEALREFQASVGKEIDTIVILPGLGDKPLIAQTPLGKVLLQFKSFLFASTNRVLYSGLQRRSDINVYQGVVSMMALGALSYTATSYLRGSPPDTSYKNLSREALDRSGLLGIWGEVFNIGQKALGFGEVSRYKSRDIWGSLVGPSGGAITEMLTLLNKVRATTTGEDFLTTKDAEKIMRLLPLQNLFYLNQLNRAVNKKVSTELGAVPVD